MISTVYIAKNVYGGDGLGRLGDGRVVFVPGAFAGESVKAEIVGEKKRYVKARLIEVVEPSPERVDISSANVVPGMVYAGLSHNAEREAKELQLCEFFERARIGVPDFRTSPPSNPFNYRNKVVYHFAKVGGDWRIGYRTEPSHEVVDVAVDPLAVPEINAALPEIRRNVLRLLTTGPAAVRRETEHKGKLTVRWTRKTGVKWWVGDAPKGLVLRENTCGRDFDVPADGFYQVNPAMGEALVAAVSEITGPDCPEVLDLYCGVGVFGLCSGAKSVTGIESGRQAIDFARANAARLGIAANFYSAQVGRNLGRLKITPSTTVIVDPPRGGLEPNVPGFLARSPAERIIYVSCDPATLMRDLSSICRGYRVEQVRWFDMFPRTARFETLAVLEKIK